MAFSATGLSEGVWGEAKGLIPTCIKASRSNTLAAPPIPIHNPLKELITAACSGWHEIMSKTPVNDIYTGVIGGTAKAAPVPVTFPAAAGAQSAFQLSQAWKGVSAASVAYLLTTAIANQTTLQAQVNMNPLPGGGLGGGVINAAANPQMAGLTSGFQAALITAFQMSSMGINVFSTKDLGTGVSKEMAKIATGLATAFTTMAVSVTGATVYAGGASPTALGPVPNLGFLK